MLREMPATGRMAGGAEKKTGWCLGPLTLIQGLFDVCRLNRAVVDKKKLCGPPHVIVGIGDVARKREA